MRIIDGDIARKKIMDWIDAFSSEQDAFNACDLIDSTPTVDQWHYPSKGEYPQYQHTSEGIEYCPLVLILVQMGNQMNVYALDRYSPSLKAWDKFHDRLVRAWMPLPEPPKEEA